MACRVDEQTVVHRRGEGPEQLFCAQRPHVVDLDNLGPSPTGAAAAEPRVAESAHELTAGYRSRAQRDGRTPALLVDVVVVVLERHAPQPKPAGEGVKLVVAPVADQVCPPTVHPGPDRGVDEDAHGTCQGRRIAEPEPPRADQLPSRIAPQKAVSGPLPTDDEGWAYEIKWDGMRIVAFVEGGRAHRVRLQSANGLDVTVGFPELSGLGDSLAGHDAILDGEVVVFDEEGRPSFGTLQQRMHVASPQEAAARAAAIPATFLVFDLLQLDGTDAMPLPYAERTRLLGDLLEEGDYWRVPGHHEGDGQAMLDAAQDQGLEGLVAKRLESAYEPGRRSPNWRKVKIRRRQELVVGGWLGGERGRSGRLGSLLVGYYEGGALRYAGRVGTGFTDVELERLEGTLADISSADCPFEHAPPSSLAPRPNWVNPAIVVEVAFGEWTSEGRLRHPSYQGQRHDKEPTEVVREPS